MQRWIQTTTLLAFLILLVLAGYPLVPGLAVDAFLRLDPLVLIGVSTAARHVLLALWPAAVMLLLTFLLGRFFCGYVCPLGTTIDLADAGIRRAAGRPARQNTPGHRTGSWTRIKYQVLAAVLAAALLGVSLLFLVSPLSLVTRLYATLLFPVLSQVGDGLLRMIRPLAELADIPVLVYLEAAKPRFSHQWLSLLLLALVFAGIRWTPRFWCRYLCPAGALFAACSRRPLLRRGVSEDCIDCGRCQRECPMAAIPADARQTRFSECIACQHCVQVCPVGAVAFSRSPDPLPAGPPYRIGRRRVIGAGIGGAAGALVILTGRYHTLLPDGPGQPMPANLIRPPGAISEPAFLAHCIRCGECMKACPTNTLQPLGLETGVSGLFSPVAVPRRGPCEPGCNVCGHVCPTGAVRALSPAEKIWAKIGTAHVVPHKCLAWELDQKCLVCDEVCPYNAVEFRQLPGRRVAVPFVHEHRCSGCGFCEHHCPARADKAIVVSPMGALRLDAGSHAARARQLGLDLRIQTSPKVAGSVSGHSPADSPASPAPVNGDLPPGFSP